MLVPYAIALCLLIWYVLGYLVCGGGVFCLCALCLRCSVLGVLLVLSADVHVGMNSVPRSKHHERDAKQNTHTEKGTSNHRTTQWRTSH